MNTGRASRRIQVGIVDDHPIARYGVKLIFGPHEHFEVVYSAGSLGELREAGAEPDVLILDLYMEGRRIATETIKDLVTRFQVLVMSASARQVDVLAAVAAGASGYVTKTATAELFVEAVRTVAAGGFYLSSELADMISADGLEQTATEQAEATVDLAPREREALGYIAQGFTQAQAARRMGISPATIDTYIRRIRRKLGAGNKADLTRRAIELGHFGAGDPGMF